MEKFVFKVVSSFNEAKAIVNQLTVKGIPDSAIQIVANSNVIESYQKNDGEKSLEVLDEQDVRKKEKTTEENKRSQPNVASEDIIPIPAITHEGLNATDGIVPMIINQEGPIKANFDEGLVDAYQADIDNGNILVVVDTEYEAAALSTQ
ncbi:hypothetical protein HZY86_00190 [Aerococcaceae bacterium DSM 111020]|nr:hypothetical protein [Aerococcaceae bacterium DSM 111020]